MAAITDARLALGRDQYVLSLTKSNMLDVKGLQSEKVRVAKSVELSENLSNIPIYDVII